MIWIGGRPYPQGGFEFNQNNDLNAVRVLFQSLELWQVPFNVYTAMKISFFEMLNHVYPCGKIGEYLVKHTMEVSGGISKNVIGSRGSDMSKGAAITPFWRRIMVAWRFCVRWTYDEQYSGKFPYGKGTR